MTRIVLCGANGKMGKVIQSVVSGRDNCEIVAGVDLNTESSGFLFTVHLQILKKQQMLLLIFLIRHCLKAYLIIQSIIIYLL